MSIDESHAVKHLADSHYLPYTSASTRPLKLVNRLLGRQTRSWHHSAAISTRRRCDPNYLYQIFTTIARPESFVMAGYWSTCLPILCTKLTKSKYRAIKSESCFLSNRSVRDLLIDYFVSSHSNRFCLIFFLLIVLKKRLFSPQTAWLNKENFLDLEWNIS